VRSSTWFLAQVVGLCVLGAQDVPIPVAQAQEARSSAPLSPFEAIPEPRPSLPQKRSGPTIQAMEFRGTARVHLSALRAILSTRVGDVYDLGALRNDAQALLRTQRFSRVDWEAEPSPEGVIVRFVLIDRPLIESIEYQGDSTVTIEEILERFHERKLKLRVETLLDENELPRAAAMVRELVGEKGRQNVVVIPMVERIGAPSIARITFMVAESQ
jgi:outer membrane protein assembly factor BamA